MLLSSLFLLPYITFKKIVFCWDRRITGRSRRRGNLKFYLVRHHAAAAIRCIPATGSRETRQPGYKNNFRMFSFLFVKRGSSIPRLKKMWKCLDSCDIRWPGSKNYILYLDPGRLSSYVAASAKKKRAAKYRRLYGPFFVDHLPLNWDLTRWELYLYEGLIAAAKYHAKLVHNNEYYKSPDSHLKSGTLTIITWL